MKICVKDVIFVYLCVIKTYMQYLLKLIKKEYNCHSSSLKNVVQNAVLVRLHVLIKQSQLTCLKIGG